MYIMASKKQGKVSWPFAILIAVVCVGGVLVIIGVMNIGNTPPINNYETPAKDTSLKNNAVTIVKDTQPINNSETLIVKGFYIGMSIDDAVKLVNGKYKDVLLPVGGCEIFGKVGETRLTEKPINIKEYSDGYSVYAWNADGSVLHFDHFVPFKNSVCSIEKITEFDASGKVTRIKFTSDEVDKLFNAADMDVQSFAQTFINNYSIPKLTPFTYYPSLHIYNDALGYTSDKGFKVIITQDKGLIIEKVPSRKERKFD